MIKNCLNCDHCTKITIPKGKKTISGSLVTVKESYLCVEQPVKEFKIQLSHSLDIRFNEVTCEKWKE